MASQWCGYSLVDSNKPNESGLIHFHYDPTQPQLPVDIILPGGKYGLTPDVLAELGCLFLALAGKETAPNVPELIRGFELPMPRHLDHSPTAREIAARIVGNFMAVFHQVAVQYKNNERERIELEETIARSLDRLIGGLRDES